jgi:hypothetical protein
LLHFHFILLFFILLKFSIEIESHFLF